MSCLNLFWCLKSEIIKTECSKKWNIILIGSVNPIQPSKAKKKNNKNSPNQIVCVAFGKPDNKIEDVIIQIRHIQKYTQHTCSTIAGKRAFISIQAQQNNNKNAIHISLCIQYR